MLRLRAALGLIAFALAARVLTIHLASGLNFPRTQHIIGAQLLDLGLPGFGALFLSRASRSFEANITKGTDKPAGSPDIRKWFTECEFALARLAQDQGQFHRAAFHYYRVSQIAPEARQEAQAWLAYTRARAGEKHGTRALLAMVVDFPTDPLPPYLAGLVFLEQHKPKEARHYLASSLELPGGKTSRALLAIARACQAEGDREESARYASEALRSSATPTEKREAAALLRAVGGNAPWPWAVWLGSFVHRHWRGLLWVVVVWVLLFAPAWFGLISGLFPTAVAPLYLLARSSSPSAIRVYEAALRRRPQSRALLRALAAAYGRISRAATRAAELWERLYLLDPNNADARDQVVRVAIESGRESEASLSACQDWFESNPGHPDSGIVATYLARAYRARPTMPPESALPAVRMAAAAAPNDRDLQLFLGGVCAHYGYYAEATEILARLLKTSPFDEACRLQYARALIGAGQPYTAYRHLRQLPPDAETTADLYLAGIAAQNAGRYRESLRILQEVLRRDPALFDVQERVAEASAHINRLMLGPFTLQETVAAHEAYHLHRARHPAHGEVLLLVFRRDFSDALEFPEAFAQHFNADCRRLPGCAEILEQGSEEEEFYVAYQLPPGAPLSALLQTQGALTPTEAIRVMVLTLRALEALHTSARLHGDLRPSLAWTDGESQAMLVGAGAALAADAGSATSRVAAHSPFYVAPEVVQSRERSVASDIYAAGCVLYELLVGAPPFQGPTHLATMVAHVTLEPEPPSMRVPNIPTQLDEIVLCALAKEPQARPRSAAEFAEALEALAPQPSESAYLPATVSESTQGTPHRAPMPTVGSASLAPPDPSRWWTLYTDLALIASGRFTRIYRGTHRHSGEQHAIKHLQLPRAASWFEGLKTTHAVQALLQLFGNEMHILQFLSEADPPVPGITTMLQAYRSEEHGPAYAMRLMHETLEQRITREGPMPERTAVPVFAAIASTVARLHELGIIHRNISPKSVMFDYTGLTVLGGFDTASRLSELPAVLAAEQEILKATQPPVSLLSGDVRYVPPERYRGENLDERSDIYSLGALLFYMLAGSPPFDREDEMQTMLNHVSANPPRLSDWNVPVSPRVEEVIYRALAKSPEARPQNIPAMLAGLTGHQPRTSHQ